MRVLCLYIFSKNLVSQPTNKILRLNLIIFDVIGDEIEFETNLKFYFDTNIIIYYSIFINNIINIFLMHRRH
jgi:hypothetical protein